MSFEHDAMISYSSKDAAWARALGDALEAKGVDMFIDKGKLEAGDDWEGELLEGLEKSRSLVVLWSANAKESDWVNRERGYIDRTKDPTRRLIIVALDDTKHAFGSTQAIHDIRKAGAYEAGADAIDANLWSDVVDKVAAGLRHNVGSRPIHLVIISTISDDLNQINPAQRVLGSSLESSLADIGAPPFASLAQYYAARREDWRPFLGNETVMTVLRNLLDEMNQLAAPFDKNFHWQPIDAGFWSDDLDDISNAAAHLATGPALVVVDPVALYDRNIAERLKKLEGELQQNDKAAVMVLAPSPIDNVSLAMRRLVKALADRIFDHVYRAADPNRALQAHCGIRILDLEDMKRIVLPALRRMLHDEDDEETHGVVSAGKKKK